MKVKRIEHVGVVVRDVEASRRLWEDCLVELAQLPAEGHGHAG